jgi:predicted metal-dependent hydrolase
VGDPDRSGIAATVALVSIAVAATNARRDRRRNLYGEAYRTTMSWIETAYRAYHAPPGDRQFLESYHKLWEDVRYYEGIIIELAEQIG